MIPDPQHQPQKREKYLKPQPRQLVDDPTCETCAALTAEIAQLRKARRACECPEPDPVMQADGRFYCHRCSFQTGARPSLLPDVEWATLQQRLRALADRFRDLRAVSSTHRPERPLTEDEGVLMQWAAHQVLRALEETLSSGGDQP